MNRASCRVLQDDEYVVYSPHQVKLKYVVQFSIEGDEPKEFRPCIITSTEQHLPPSVQGEYNTVSSVCLTVVVNALEANCVSVCAFRAGLKGKRC